MLQDPPHADYHIELGEVSSYPPGYKENGGVFCHTNPWIMIAEAMMGDSDAAFDYYTRTTTDLLFQYEVPVPPNLYTQAWLNLGEIQNRGLELTK